MFLQHPLRSAECTPFFYSSFPPWEHFVKTQITPACFSVPAPMWIFSWPGHMICNSTSLPTTSMYNAKYRGTSISPLLLEIPIYQDMHAFFMAKAKDTFLVHNHSETKYCSTVFTTTFPIRSSQYSLYYIVYIVYMLNTCTAACSFLFNLHVFAFHLWKIAFHPISFVPALKVIHFFLDDFPNFLCQDNVSQHRGISRF